MPRAFISEKFLEILWDGTLAIWAYRSECDYVSKSPETEFKRNEACQMWRMATALFA